MFFCGFVINIGNQHLPSVFCSSTANILAAKDGNTRRPVFSMVDVAEFPEGAALHLFGGGFCAPFGQVLGGCVFFHQLNSLMFVVCNKSCFEHFGVVSDRLVDISCQMAGIWVAFG